MPTRDETDIVNNRTLSYLSLPSDRFPRHKTQKRCTCPACCNMDRVAQTDGPSGSPHRGQLSDVKPSGHRAAGGGRQDRRSRGEPEKRPDACLLATPGARETD